MASRALWIGVALMLSGCQSNRSNGYADLINQPLPASDTDREHECAWLRSEVARQQSLAQYGATTASTPMMAVVFQAAARKNIADLQSRYSQIQCDVVRVAPVSSPPASHPAEMSFDDCFAKCKTLTTRSENECFDACRK